MISRTFQVLQLWELADIWLLHACLSGILLSLGLRNKNLCCFTLTIPNSSEESPLHRMVKVAIEVSHHDDFSRIF